MSRLDLEQGTPEWLAFRKTKITATDIGIILGVNPYQTIDELVNQKINDVEVKQSAAMKRGSSMESSGRAHFILHESIWIEPCVYVSDEHPWLMASLDGLCPDEELVVEIKCGRKSYLEAENGHVPEYYYSQIQAQLLVTGASKAIYYAFNGKKGIPFEFEPDIELHEEIIQKSKEFHEMILQKKKELLNVSL